MAGRRDPLGGVNILWPLFGISTSCWPASPSVATGIIIKMGKLLRRVGPPLTWLAIICTWAAWRRYSAPTPRSASRRRSRMAAGLPAGTLPERAAVAPQLIIGQNRAALAFLFAVILGW